MRKEFWEVNYIWCRLIFLIEFVLRLLFYVVEDKKGFFVRIIDSCNNWIVCGDGWSVCFSGIGCGLGYV